MSAAVVLDSGPLGLLSNPHASANPTACRAWLADLLAAGRRVIVPELADYEVRRSLLLHNLSISIGLLDGLGSRLEFLPVTSAAWRRAAELWADAWRQGVPTAAKAALDGDVILAAQALTLGVPVVVATGNVNHISRYVLAERCENIPP